MNLSKGNGKSLNDTHMIEKILQLLDSKFDYIVVTIEGSKDVNTFFYLLAKQKKIY